MDDRLREALTRRQKRHIINSGLTPAAVLLPLYYQNGQYYILFTKRTEEMKVHKGQISFPGGTYHEEDETLLNTALRECDEEIGLKAGEIEILGELDDTLTETTGYIISPFVAFIPSSCQFMVNRGEIADIIEVPILSLLDERHWHENIQMENDRAVTRYVYYSQGNVIWGATARILGQFLDIFGRAMEDEGG